MGRPAYIGLTPRQQEVVHLVAQGLTNPQIAVALTITPGTACSYIKQIKQRAGVRTRAQVRALAEEYRRESEVGSAD
jgi:DNA-binding NarL/FixJ family response regulator